MPKILLAEDDNDMRRFLVKALQSAGFEVTDYDNGLAAYRRLREEPFQLLLTDIVMPEMDGIELARRASELDPDMKIMFITGPKACILVARMERSEMRERLPRITLRSIRATKDASARGEGSCLAGRSRYKGPCPTSAGRVAQRESTTLTS